MPISSVYSDNFKSAKIVSFQWDTFRKGLNTILRENEIDKEELSQADNILLIGKGIPTKRWGTSLYFNAGNATGQVRGLKGMYYSNGTIELVSLTDDGFLTMKDGLSFTRITGASWASGYPAYMEQLDDTLYIVNGQRELVKYSNPTLVGFPTIAVPVPTLATNISGASGTTTKGYRISAISQVGETVASDTIELRNQPITLGEAGGQIKVVWGAVSTASGILRGYNIYGRESGNERFLGSVDPSSTTFIDDGAATPLEFTFPPTADSTGGPVAKYIKRFQDRLVFAGLQGEPSKILISGRVPNQTKFDVSYGGNYLLIEPDAGDNVTQITTFRDRIVVFKEKSIWQVTLKQEQIGNFFVTTPDLQLVTASRGCIAPRSVVAVEQDIYFLSRDGVQSLGYESGFAFDFLKSNQLSVKIRPFFDSLTIAQKESAVAVYDDYKYIIAFPGLNKMMVFDRERQAWVGPWSIDASVFEIFFDDNNDKHLLIGDDTSVAVDDFSSDYNSDKGTAISTILRTKQEDFGDWSLFKNIRSIFTQFRNVTGTVSANVRLEQRSGSVLTAQSFNITPQSGNSGWGADMWGAFLWGDTSGEAGGGDTQQIIRWANLNKSARTMQLTIKTDNLQDNYELLGIRGDVKPIRKGFLPSSWRI